MQDILISHGNLAMLASSHSSPEGKFGETWREGGKEESRGVELGAHGEI